MNSFVLIVALLGPAGELHPYMTLTPPISLAECMRIKESRVVQISYLEDAWLGRKIPGRPVLVCGEVNNPALKGGAL